MTRGDRVLIGLLAALVIVSVPASVTASGPAGTRVVIEGPTGASVAPLADDAYLIVEGRVGEVHVEISDGAARVVSSECPDHTCIAMGAVDTPAEAIICVPNGVVVRVEGDGDVALDTVVR